MKPLFDRWLPALTLALWGGAILLYAFDGRVRHVLAFEFIVYAVIAAVLLLTGALVFALYPVDASCCAGSACGHGLSRSSTGRFLTFGIILLPIALAPFGSKAALDEVLAKNRVSIDDSKSFSKDMIAKLEKKFANRPPGSSTAPEPAPVSSTPPAPAPATPSANAPEASATALNNPPMLPGAVQPPPPLPLPAKDGSTPPAPAPAKAPQAPTDYLIRTPDGLIVAEVIDLLYAAQDNTLRADFEGKRVELKGQFLPDKTSSSPQRFKAVTMMMTCCAADARPIATLVEIDKMPDFKEMEWVRIVGKPNFPVEKGRRISVLKAEIVEKTEPIPLDGPGGPQ